jgi:hypothetical protein
VVRCASIDVHSSSARTYLIAVGEGRYERHVGSEKLKLGHLPRNMMARVNEGSQPGPHAPAQNAEKPCRHTHYTPVFRTKGANLMICAAASHARAPPASPSLSCTCARRTSATSKETKQAGGSRARRAGLKAAHKSRCAAPAAIARPYSSSVLAVGALCTSSVLVGRR